MPTFAEAGFPGIEAKGWMGVMVPLALPSPSFAGCMGSSREEHERWTRLLREGVLKRN